MPSLSYRERGTQNGFCESLDGRMRDELLNESLFFSLHPARARNTD
jgi:putative transposase